jgi:intracellular sulfur oxidation DsrE/DsrF family protein
VNLAGEREGVVDNATLKKLAPRLEICMKTLSRRSFVSVAAAGMAALTAPSALEAERIYHTGDWQMPEFNTLLKTKYEIKQSFDITAIDDGNAFDHMTNSLNGLHFGFGIPYEKIKIVAAIRSKATVMNFNDAMWEKYQIGAWLKVDDPKTKKPAVRNPFYASEYGSPAKYPSANPNDEKSFEEDGSIQALQQRGMQLLACHMAVGAMAEGAVKRLKLAVTKDAVTDELQKNLLPGVIVVPSMVSAIPMLQTKGQFSYIRM